jgi:DNA polymerase II large subunit
MSDTPRTDALVDGEIRKGVSFGESEIYDFARQLERELAEALAALREAQATWGDCAEQDKTSVERRIDSLLAKHDAKPS